MMSLIKLQASTEGKIDVEDNKNHKAYQQIDLGFSAERSLRKALWKVTILRSRQCNYALIGKMFWYHLKELFLSVVFYIPESKGKTLHWVQNQDERVMSALVNAWKVKEKDYDGILQEFDTFIEKVPVIGSDEDLIQKRTELISFFCHPHVMRSIPETKSIK